MDPKLFFEQGRKFFFNDRDLTAEYVKANCKEELNHILRVADEVCRQEFKFDLRWDMEQTAEPVVFKDKIDWLFMPGDDPEFIYAFNRMRFWICLGQAYAVTKDEKYADAFVNQLLGWIESVPHIPENDKAWRTLETGLRMEYWIKAMMYFKGSPAITAEVMDKFVASMTEHAEFIMSVWNWYNMMSNWGVMANHGLFVAGVMLPETERTKEYISTAIKRLDTEIRLQVYDDGTQWEQSPMYHNEVTQLFYTVVILAERNNIPLPEGFAERVHKMALANVYWQKPNGEEISNGDSDEIDVRDVTTIGAAFFHDPLLKGSAYPELDFDSAWEVGAELAEEYKNMKSENPAEQTVALKDSGNFYLRSGWTKDDTFMHFHCGTLGAGHGHSDQLHIDLYANQEDILMDSGRYTYVDKIDRFEFKDAAAHNTTIVDGSSCYNYIDSWECSKLDRAVNRVCKDFKNYAYVEGGHLGYMHSLKGGVFANRRIIYLKPDIFVLVDEFYTNGIHSYQNFLHFNNKGKLTELASGNWKYSSERNEAQFLMIAPDSSTEKIKTRLSRHYNYVEENETLKTQWTSREFSYQFTVISINKAGEFEEVKAELLPVRSNFKNWEFKDYQIQALKIQKGKKDFLVVVGHEEYATPTDTFSTDGCVGFGNAVVFNRAAGETEIGTVLNA